MGFISTRFTIYFQWNIGNKTRCSFDVTSVLTLIINNYQLTSGILDFQNSMPIGWINEDQVTMIVIVIMYFCFVGHLMSMNELKNLAIKTFNYWSKNTPFPRTVCYLHDIWYLRLLQSCHEFIRDPQIPLCKYPPMITLYLINSSTRPVEVSTKFRSIYHDIRRMPTNTFTLKNLHFWSQALKTLLWC